MDLNVRAMKYIEDKMGGIQKSHRVNNEELKGKGIQFV